MKPARPVHSVPPVRFEEVGEGYCHDETGNQYDHSAAVAVDDLEACMSMCSKSAHSGALVGLDFYDDLRCQCNFLDGFLEDDGGTDPKPCNSIYFDDIKGIGIDQCHTKEIGKGKVDGHDNTSGVTCYRVTEDTVSV